MNYFRFFVIYLILLFLIPMVSNAQSKTIQGTNFSVPEAPAFVLLNEYPTTILRPGDLRTLTVQVADFANSGGVLPKTFAMEFSPAMLLNGASLSIQEYQKNPYPYRFYLSAGVKRINESSGRTQGSIGFRFTMFDDADPRLDTNYLAKLGNILLSDLQQDEPTAPPTGSVTHTTRDNLEQQITALQKSRANRLWNAEKIEIGFGSRYDAKDSLAKNFAMDKIAGWFSATFPVGSTGQFLFGLTAMAERSKSGLLDSTLTSVAARFYLGANTLKAFGEVQVLIPNDNYAQQFLGFGVEFNPAGGFWLDVSFGINKKGSNDAIFQSMFNIHWNLLDFPLASKN
jgi:hypothetical protein